MAERQTIPVMNECPFCGCDNINPLVDGDLRYTCMQCDKCGAQGPYVMWDIKERAKTLCRIVELWNNRHERKE